MKVLVVGATGGSGRAAVTELVARGHEVTALSRHASSLPDVRGVDGDATDPVLVDRLVQGQDAVVVTLGISESAVRVRLRGPSGTPLDIRSRGTRTVLAAMRRHGVRRVVVQTSYGVGPTKEYLPLASRLVFALLLRPQIADTERQGAELRASGLDWVEVQPVNLTDEPWAGPPATSTDGGIEGLKVSRSQVGWLLAEAVEDPLLTRRTVSVSAGARVPVTA
ncbi:NAD(P)-binding oxidoreductase [uncultured Cellulomonas sp.]|uniref:NAD(P)-dependent oxidoreductase n=1 Tax=uncultured Cellulomonas sp. TaxID=189682 RepID=UPI0028ECAFA1|nr:NAD(P)-binding oxidoreductase [uncultured Cellulomonas sp.]